MSKMKINEIFYSLQGEGFWTGTPMVFLRLAGCNLHCPFCDTEWKSFEEMSENEILEAITQFPTHKICITGGEPCLQLTESFVNRLHQNDFTVHVESNGTIIPPPNVDWLTVSPKAPFLSDGKGKLAIDSCDELKLLYPSNPEQFSNIKATYRFLQPIDESDPEKTRINRSATIDYICSHPEWRLSLQIHKFLKIK